MKEEALIRCLHADVIEDRSPAIANDRTSRIKADEIGSVVEAEIGNAPEQSQQRGARE